MQNNALLSSFWFVVYFGSSSVFSLRTEFMNFQVCAILNGVTNLGVNSYYVSLLAWLLLIVVLGFFVHLLEDVIDTVYVCYAIDRDRAEVNKPEVHDVYVQLPISRSTRTPLNV